MRRSLHPACPERLFSVNKGTYNRAAFFSALFAEDAIVTKLLRMRLGLLTALLLAAGCVGSRQSVPSSGYVAPNADIVFVADGSGDYRTTSKTLSEAVRACCAPLNVETFVWSHGYGRMLVDHMDHCNHQEEGRRLAGFIAAARQSCPERGVYLVGHSSGAAVVLAAAEASPPGSIERIVLLAPAVACDYDLRPALRSVHRCIDVFVSRRDIGALGLGTGIGGTADRRWSAASGRVGFTPILTCPGDELLYAKLRTHPWDRCVVWSGNRGSHYGTLEQGFMRAYVLPLLSRSP
jgi:pimeloyl-ACP methyl ester carboxylesterase